LRRVGSVKITLRKIYIQRFLLKIMAKKSRTVSGTFFLRDSLNTDGTTFQTSATDISSFVNVLEGEVLRVKQIWWEWRSDDGSAILNADVGANNTASAMASVSSELRTTVGAIRNSSVLSGNIIYVHGDSNGQIDMITNETSANPADFDDGYLIATDALHLNVDQTADTFAADLNVVVMMECEMVKLSLSDAQAVLVSQTVG